MREYELVFILDPDLSEEAIQGLMDRFQTLAANQGANVKKMERWERRRLAYEIKRKRDGIYVVMPFEGSSAAADELDRVLHITEGILRHLIVRAEYMKGEQGRMVSSGAPPQQQQQSYAPPVSEAAPAEEASSESSESADETAADSDETVTIAPESAVEEAGEATIDAAETTDAPSETTEGPSEEADVTPSAEDDEAASPA